MPAGEIRRLRLGRLRNYFSDGLAAVGHQDFTVQRGLPHPAARLFVKFANGDRLHVTRRDTLCDFRQRKTAGF